jgi:RsmE family RNA methyltransferase
VNLVILEPDEVSTDGEVRLADGRAGHVLDVLKVQPGQTVRVGVLDGPSGVATVQTVEDGTVHMRCAFSPDLPPRPRLDLLLAVPRPKVLRRLWAQLAALGVGRVMLTNAERVERNYFDTHILSPECYRPLLVEGLQQARDTRLPQVTVHRQFKVLIEDHLDSLFPEGLRIVAHPGADRSIREVARNHSGDRILLAVGPEGGWNAFELALLHTHGFRAAGMGPRTLRTDTACVALLSLLNDVERDGSQ